MAPKGASGYACFTLFEHSDSLPAVLYHVRLDHRIDNIVRLRNNSEIVALMAGVLAILNGEYQDH